MSLEQYLVPIRDHSNLCLDCATPIMECPWHRFGQEVPGWKTSLSRRWNRERKVYEETFQIIACPLHTPPDPNRQAKQDKELLPNKSARTFY